MGKSRAFVHSTLIMGLLYTFVSLWILSIFGNYVDADHWSAVRQYDFLHWSILFGAACLVALWYGIRHEHRAVLGFGMTFWIDLYTRYFEYFWDGLHKAVFFSVLALSFWWLGSRAEYLWMSDSSLSWRALLTSRRPRVERNG